MPGSTGARPTKDETYQRRRRAIELRLAGASWEEVARAPRSPDDPRRLYADRHAARKAVQAALREHLAAEVEEYRFLHGARLERLLRASWPLAMQGSAEHQNAALRTMAQIADLWGLNAPKNVVVGGELDAEIQALIASMAPADPTWDLTGVPAEVAGELSAGGGIVDGDIR